MLDTTAQTLKYTRPTMLPALSLLPTEIDDDVDPEVDARAPASKKLVGLAREIASVAKAMLVKVNIFSFV